MTTYQPRTPHSDSIVRPPCPKCQTQMRLFGIEPEKPGHETHSFECPACHHVEAVVAKLD